MYTKQDLRKAVGDRDAMAYLAELQPALLIDCPTCGQAVIVDTLAWHYELEHPDHCSICGEMWTANCNQANCEPTPYDVHEHDFSESKYNNVCKCGLHNPKEN